MTANKPITVRLDEIEQQMIEINNNHKKSIESTERLIIAIHDFTLKTSKININSESIHDSIKREIMVAMKQINGIPSEWLELINYAEHNNIDIKVVFEMVKILNYDFEKVKI